MTTPAPEHIDNDLMLRQRLWGVTCWGFIELGALKFSRTGRALFTPDFQTSPAVMSTARKSLTLVRVGPVTIRSLSRSKKL